MRRRSLLLLVLCLITIGLVIVPGAYAQKNKLQGWRSRDWHPGMMRWNYVGEDEDGIKIVYSDQEFTEHKNGNFSFWVGVETKDKFDLSYVTVDKGRRLYTVQKHYSYDKNTRILSYLFDIMRLLPPDRWYITDEGGSWNPIKRGSIIDKVIKKIYHFSWRW